MEYKNLTVRYFPSFDRFILSNRTNHGFVEEMCTSKYYNGLEYFRYIPDEDLAMEHINEFLCVQPQELCCEITTDCNLECPICIADASHDNAAYLPIYALTSFLEQTPYIPKRITLSGGEPTLHPEFIEFVDCVSRTSTLVISSNGLKPALLLQATEVAKNTVLQISLHGAEKQHDSFVKRPGSFQTALESIRVCCKKAAKIEILTIADPEVLGFLQQFFTSIEDLPIAEIRFNLAKHEGRQEVSGVMWKDLLDEIKKCELNTKVTVKRLSQPYIFMSVWGEVMQKHG